MALACRVCAVVYLALSSRHSTINWGASQDHWPRSHCSPKRLKPREDEEKNKNGGVKGGKWRGIQTGSGCNFLRKLSKPFPVRTYLMKRENETEKRNSYASV